MIPVIQLNNGQKMPQEGLGTFQITDFETCKNAVLKALDLGYRLIDTAQVYRNERAVGAALKLTTVPRADIFVTTKVWLPFFGDDVTAQSVENSLQRMGLDYLDLVLLHEPYGDYYGAYRDLEKLVMVGKIKSIGVSNFDAGQLLDLSHQMKITPAVNQVELNLYQQQTNLRKFQTENKIAIEAWAPLGEVNGSILQEPIVLQIAKKYHKTSAQVLLHYLVQLGAAIIPKAVQESHMRDNLAIWNFDFSALEMRQLAILDKNKWLSPNRHTFSSTKHYMDLIDEGLDY